MLKYILFSILAFTCTFASEYHNPEEHYRLHTDVLPSGHGSPTGYSQNDEQVNTQIISDDENLEEESQEDGDVQYIRVKYIPQPVYKYVQATAPAPAPVTEPAPTASAHEPIVKYVQQRQQVVKYLPQHQIIKYVQQPRAIKYFQQRIVKVPQRVIYKYVPYYTEQHENLQKSNLYKATPAPQQQQHHNTNHVTGPVYRPGHIGLPAPSYEHSSESRRNHQEHHEHHHEHHHEQQ